MKTLLIYLTIALLPGPFLAYGPTSISRRSIIQNSIMSVLIAPTISLAEDSQQSIDDEPIMADNNSTDQGKDELPEFTFWRKRSHQYLKRRMEREKKRSQNEKSDDTTEDMGLSSGVKNDVDIA